jgi:hypothetical protein
MNMHGPNSSRKKNATNEDVIYNGTNQVDIFMEEKENEGFYLNLHHILYECN